MLFHFEGGMNCIESNRIKWKPFKLSSKAYIISPVLMNKGEISYHKKLVEKNSIFSLFGLHVHMLSSGYVSHLTPSGND